MTGTQPDHKQTSAILTPQHSHGATKGLRWCSLYGSERCWLASHHRQNSSPSQSGCMQRNWAVCSMHMPHSGASYTISYRSALWRAGTARWASGGLHHSERTWVRPRRTVTGDGMEWDSVQHQY